MVTEEPKEKLRKYLEKIRDEARNKSLKYSRLAQRADEGLRYMNWYETFVQPKMKEFQFANDIEVSEDIMDYSFLGSNMSIAGTIVADVDDVEKASTIVSSVVSSIQNTASGATLSLIISGDYSNELLSEPMFDHEELKKEIDEHLLSLVDGEKLVESHESVWITFHSGAPDCIKLACHSMREVLTRILDEYCPNDKVKEADWFVEEISDKVTKKQKIKYFIVGDNNFPIDDEVEELDRQINDIYDLHGKLAASAHTKIIERRTAEKLLYNFEHMINIVLQLRVLVQQ